MTRFSHVAWLGLTVLGLVGCGSPPVPTGAHAQNAPPARERLALAVEKYWDERPAQADTISPQAIADLLSMERRFFEEVRTIPREDLDADSKLTYDIFERRLALAIEGDTYPAELMPISPFGGTAQRFAFAAQDAAQRPFASAADYESWLKRVDDYVQWTRQAIANMREGVRRGYTSPRAVIERMLPILERLGEDGSTNVFYSLVRSLPESIKDPDRTRLTKALSGGISEKLLPANRALHDFLQHEYLPRTRTGLALSELPLGPSWYAYRVKRATDTSLPANEIHRIGLAEVERLRPRLAAITVPPPAEKNSGSALAAYQDLSMRVAAAIPSSFSLLPKSEVELRAARLSGMTGALLAYLPADPAGRRPAVLYVITGVSTSMANGASVPAFLREALPGHHLQSALQQERGDLPRFRRFVAEPGFVEGWDLYAASLGEELGLYTEEDAKYESALQEMHCAVGLVVDTGLHSQGWTRARALDYLRAQMPLDDAGAQSMVDGYAANPADALACKMGEMKIQSLRNRAQQALGSRFDIREFHSEILKDGAMPLDVLEAKVNAWLDAAR